MKNHENKRVSIKHVCHFLLLFSDYFQILLLIVVTYLSLTFYWVCKCVVYYVKLHGQES